MTRIISRRAPRRVLAALAVTGLVSAGVLLTGAPAMAASQDITTGNVQWFGFDYTTGAVDDAGFNYPGLGTSGVGAWTDGDAFDTIGDFSITSCSTTATFSGASQDSFGLDGAGHEVSVSTFTNDFGCGVETVVLTTTFAGDYVQWSYTFSGPAAIDAVAWSGNLGSDGDATYSDQTATTFTENDASFSDPSMALQVQTDAASSAWTLGVAPLSSVDDIEHDAVGPITSYNVTLKLADYTVRSGQAEAAAALTAEAPTLENGFGGIHAQPYQGTDAGIYGSASGTTGTALAADVTSVYPTDDYYGGGDYFNPAQTNGNVLDYTLGTLPPGLSATLTFDGVNGQPVVHLTGTPTTAGTFTVPVTVFLSGEGSFAPLISSFVVTIAKPTLAATGTDDVAPFLGGLALLGLGLAVVFVTTRRRTVIEG